VTPFGLFPVPCHKPYRSVLPTIASCGCRGWSTRSPARQPARFSERIDCRSSMVTQVRNAGFIRRARNDDQVGSPPTLRSPMVCSRCSKTSALIASSRFQSSVTPANHPATTITQPRRAEAERSSARYSPISKPKAKRSELGASHGDVSGFALYARPPFAFRRWLVLISHFTSRKSPRPFARLSDGVSG
jgi:hypothetical protein